MEIVAVQKSCLISLKRGKIERKLLLTAYIKSYILWYRCLPKCMTFKYLESRSQIIKAFNDL